MCCGRLLVDTEDKLTGHPPPNSDEAERGVLGCMMLDATRVIGLIQERGLFEDSFYTPAHRCIFTAILEVYAEHQTVDLLMVCQHLKDRQLLEQAGGDAYVEKMIDGVPTDAHAEYYIEIVGRKAAARANILVARELIERCYDNDDPQTAASDAVARLMEAETTSASPDHAAEHRRRRELVKTGGSMGWPSFLYPLERLLGSYCPGECIILAAKTSTGKTAFIMNELLHKAKLGVPCAINSTADMDAYGIATRFAGMISGVNTFKFRHEGFTAEDEEKIEAGFRAFEKLPIHINEHRINRHQWLAWATNMVVRRGCKIIVTDFIQQMQMTREEERRDFRLVIGEWAAFQKSFAKRHGVTNVIVSQFSRSGRKEEDEVTPPPPTAEALKETSSLEQSADKVLLLYRKPGLATKLFTHEYPVWDIDAGLVKHRDGPTGVVNLSLHNQTQRFMSSVAGEELRMLLAKVKE